MNPSVRVAEGVVDDLLGTVDPMIGRLVVTAAGDDREAVQALVLCALGLSVLANRAGAVTQVRLAELLQRRSPSLPGAQRAALCALAEAWAGSGEPAIEPPQRSAPEAAKARLTERQRQILTLLGDGLTGQAIAHRLRLSPRTVGKHLERIYRRLGTSDRLTAVMRAQRCGLLRSGGTNRGYGELSAGLNDASQATTERDRRDSL